MKRILLVSALTLVMAGVGCGREGGRASGGAAAGAGGGSGEILARVHFVGLDQVWRDTNSAKLRQVAGLSESRAFAEQTLTKLAHAARTLYPGAVDAAEDERGAALVRPLLDDLVHGEFFLQVRGVASAEREWTLLAQVSGDGAKRWGEALPGLMKAWGVGEAVAGSVEGFPGGSVQRGAAPARVQWFAAGSWVALGVGPSSLPVLGEAARRLKAGGRPVNPAADYWVDLDLNLARLGGEIGLAKEVAWPRVRLKVAGRGENLRTTGTFEFPKPMTGELGEHRVPVQSIREPVISFASARGVGPWLEQVGLLRDLGVTPAPNEVVMWGQSGMFFQTFWAFPAGDAVALVQRVGEQLPRLLGEAGARRALNEVEYTATNRTLTWKRLPLIVPRLQAREVDGRPMVFGEIFPPVPSTNLPPADLFRQLAGRTNLVYYGWEVTQQRLSSWHWTLQLLSVIAQRPQLSTNYPGLRWMVQAGPQLGNTVTEVTAASPTRWELSRRSHLGLSGLEIVLLTRWLESTNFPALSLDPLPAPLYTNRAAAVAPGKP